MKTGYCAEIEQSVDVSVPLETADKEWTQFAFESAVSHRSRHPDESEAESGLIRMTPLDDRRTRLTVVITCCPHRAGISDPDAIADVRRHLGSLLDDFVLFVESTRTKGMSRRRGVSRRFSTRAATVRRTAPSMI